MLFGLLGNCCNHGSAMPPPCSMYILAHASPNGVWLWRADNVGLPGVSMFFKVWGALPYIKNRAAFSLHWHQQKYRICPCMTARGSHLTVLHALQAACKTCCTCSQHAMRRYHRACKKSSGFGSPRQNSADVCLRVQNLSRMCLMHARLPGFVP